ncbi:acyl-CoA dehydrogenase family protein [Sporosarcina obsidiansis]|uniref:acyl-CoA dehydrogenase family protein n=1 Tax=Sporosarcina obsidiansis TaxID=2660748 RepID=UPI00129BF2FE|nr:acyl-CoA dehydrogenase family protein [Sporosarcina obsidiansis]
MITAVGEDVEVIYAKLCKFIQDELLPYEGEHNLNSEEEIPMEAIRWVRERSRELGFYGVNLPRELGGQNLSLKGEKRRDWNAKRGSQL